MYSLLTLWMFSRRYTKIATQISVIIAFIIGKNGRSYVATCMYMAKYGAVSTKNVTVLCILIGKDSGC